MGRAVCVFHPESLPVFICILPAFQTCKYLLPLWVELCVFQPEEGPALQDLEDSMSAVSEEVRERSLSKGTPAKVGTMPNISKTLSFFFGENM